MPTYPVEMNGGWWFVWSLPVENTIGGEHRAAGLTTFATYEEAKKHCFYANKQLRIERGLPLQRIENLITGEVWE
jgi:hypothetical protein